MKLNYQIHVPATVPQNKQTAARIEWQVGRNLEPVSALGIAERYLQLLGIRSLTLRSPSPNLLLLAVTSNPTLKCKHEKVL